MAVQRAGIGWRAVSAIVLRRVRIRSPVGPAPAALLVAAALLAPAAHGELLLGVETGTMLLQQARARDPINAGVTLGIDLDVLLADLGFAAEVTGTVRDGRSRGGADIAVHTNALYALVKTTGTVYFHARAGLVEHQVTVAGRSSHDTGPAIGGGLGIFIGRARLELAYTRFDDVADFASIALRF